MHYKQRVHFLHYWINPAILYVHNRSTLNTIGRDIIEIEDRQTLTVGYFSGSIYQSQVQNNPQISASSNIFVLRSGADFNYGADNF